MINSPTEHLLLRSNKLSRHKKRKACTQPPAPESENIFAILHSSATHPVQRRISGKENFSTHRRALDKVQSVTQGIPLGHGGCMPLLRRCPVLLKRIHFSSGRLRVEIDHPFTGQDAGEGTYFQRIRACAVSPAFVT